MIGRDIVFEIHRMHHEGLSERQISQHLQINRRTVSRYLKDPDPIKTKRTKSSKLDPFKSEIKQMLDKHASVSAVVIKQHLDAMGFNGGITIVKDYLRTIRRKHSPTPFIRFESKPGRQMQVDWGHFGVLTYGKTKRKLYALAMVEAHSRMLYVTFTHSQKQDSLHQCILNGFTYFGGCPKQIVVDNMLTAVTERAGRIIRFNDAFYDFLRRFNVAPYACNIRSPQEKGKVENAIKYIRNNFWPLRRFSDLFDIQAQAVKWCNEIANIRIHQTTGQRPIDRLVKSALSPLPGALPDVRQTESVKVHADFAVRFDGNAYTVPPWTIGKTAVVKADPLMVTIYLHEKKIAAHSRCYERKKRIESQYHREQVKRLKKKLWQDRDVAVFCSMGPEAAAYLQSISDAGLPIKTNIIKLLKLKDEYGAQSLLIAIRKASEHKAFGADYVENILYQEMTPKTTVAPVKLKNDELNQIRLKEPSLADYDAHILKKRRFENE